MAFSIEAPFALLEIPVKMLSGNAVKAAHVALGLVPEVLDSVDVILLVGEEFRVIDTLVMEVRHVERVVGFKAVRVDDAVRRDFVLDDVHQRLARCVRDDRCIDLAAAL